jgi:biopolymer transport protein ExbD
MFYVLTTAFTFFPDIDVELPKTITSDAVQEENFVVTITSENVIYWRNKIVSIKDLQVQLSQLSKNNSPILIKSDRRASVGRIVDVWDLCRAMGIERINIATNREQ